MGEGEEGSSATAALAELQGRAERLKATRAANATAAEHRPSAEQLRKTTDASVKKVGAFIRKLKSNLFESHNAALLSDVSSHTPLTQSQSRRARTDRWRQSFAWESTSQKQWAPSQGLPTCPRRT